jgi:uncharacterized membrane protein YccC
LEKNRKYFSTILDEYEKKNPADDLEYRIARREAHQADNALALAWQDMQSEPSKYRQFHQRAFKLTHLNHALLSFISAFGAHRKGTDTMVNEIITCGRSILKILGQTRSKSEHRLAEIMALIQNLQQRVKTGKTDSNRQKFIILYNIADISRQLISEDE